MTPRALTFVSLLGLLSLASCGGQPDAAAAPTPPRTPNAVAMVTPALDAPPPTDASHPTPPVAAKVPHDTTMSGHVVHDDYAWMRAKDSPDVLSYLKAENAYTDAMTKDLLPLRDKLYDEVVARLKETDSSAPFPERGWLYYWRTEKGKEYPIACRRRQTHGGPEAPEVVLLDRNEIAKTEKFVGLGDYDRSDDGNLFAYGLDTTGFRQFDLHVKDLRTGKELAERIPRVDSVAFAADGKHLFYVTEDPQTKRPNQLRSHVLGADVSKDPLVYDEKDERFTVGIYRSTDRDFIVIQIASETASEVRLIDARHPDSAPRLVEPRSPDHEYYVSPAKGLLYIRTNSGGRNFRLVTAPVATPDRAHWKEIVPHRPDVMLEDVDAFRGHVVLWERHDAKMTLRSLDAKTGASHPIAVDAEVYELGGAPNREFDSDVYRFQYSSPTVPLSVVEENVRTGKQTLVKRDEVPGFDPSKYVAERIHVAARDGTVVPVSVVHAASLKPDGTHPLYLTGYGAYGFPHDVSFDSRIVSALDRGVVYAIAHIRGGGDLGKPWHDGGRMATKMNTFTDFIDAAEGLLKDGWARPGSIAIEGRSAGGLLMGAVTNLRPDLWRAVVASVPFVDVLNTMYDETVPLTVQEFEEWGNPKVPEQFGWLAAYSPYDNVAKKDYPAMLVESSYNDSQVMYWEPTKWVAKLRAYKTDHNPLYLRMNMDPAGHGGHAGRYEHIRERAYSLAFVLDQLGARGN